MMLPGNDRAVSTRHPTQQRMRWFNPTRCSICTRFIWLRLIVLNEPPGAPEPRCEWVLCKTCHKALLMEIQRSSLRSSVSLRIAIGLVAAERSPHAYTLRSSSGEQQRLEREFTWFIWLLVLFALLHLVILVIVWVAPK